MNPFQLDVANIRGELPAGGVIPREQLDDYLGAAAVLKRNRSRAATVLLAARRDRARVRRQAREILEQAYAEADRRADEAARAAHDATCMAVVQWLVRERKLEARVAAALEERCRNWVADAVLQFTGELDKTSLLIGRIERQLAPVARHGALRLHVCPDEIEAVACRLSGRDGIELHADAAMAPGQARIDSPFVQLRIDLARHIDMLLDRIRGARDEDAGGDGDIGALDTIDTAELPFTPADEFAQVPPTREDEFGDGYDGSPAGGTAGDMSGDTASDDWDDWRLPARRDWDATQ
ncbi:hypothetical protein [Paracidovorax citrulli]